MKGATEIAGMGSFSIIADPTGAMLSLWDQEELNAGPERSGLETNCARRGNDQPSAGGLSCHG
jgi:hypothetical protein